MTTNKIKKILLNNNGNNFVADIENIENRITQTSSNLESAKQELSDKCNTVLSDAKAYTDQEKANYIKKSGDVITGANFTRNKDDSYLFFNGGTGQTGASLVLYGKDSSSLEDVKGSAELRTKSDIRLKCRDNGTLLWNGQNIVRTVNGAVADKNGNVDVISHVIQNVNNFASTLVYNNTALKIQCIRISGDQGQNYGTINWLVPFTNTNYHVFATSEDPDENLEFQIADVSFLNKTTTSCRVGHKVENINVFYTGGSISVLGIGF